MDNNLGVVYDTLCRLGIDARCNAPLHTMSKIGCGGSVDILVMPRSEQQLVTTMNIILSHGVPYYILGGASKVLIPDGHSTGVVVCTRAVRGIHIDISTNSAYVSCGTHTVVCANYLASVGLSGAEYMYCLPATVGGAVYMNAGCYSQCTADIVDSVHCLDTVSGQLLDISSSQCQWGRRSSVFATRPLLILGVNLLLTNGNKQCIIDSMKGNMIAKLAHQPLNMPSLGSSHYTISGMSASALTDRAGLKGYTIGRAQISPKHAGFVINLGGATSSHVQQLLQYTEQRVAQLFDVTLHQEIIHMTMRRSLA